MIAECDDPKVAAKLGLRREDETAGGREGGRELKTKTLSRATRLGTCRVEGRVDNYDLGCGGLLMENQDRWICILFSWVAVRSSGK